ncbi:MAG TPA: VOC family protein [Anaerolineae bacterium]|nr:VOC family protein [Anaerolineae bacterium]
MYESIHPNTHLGHVSITIPNMDRSLDFYQNALGMKVHRKGDGTAMLGGGGADVLELIEDPSAKRASRTSGLYHFAILRPSRFELAQSLRRLAEARWRSGSADHLVSEAIYLSDPDGNGIEIYRDRSRSDWPRFNGQIQMATDPLDVEGILAELEGHAEPWTGMEDKTILGHMHLHVGDVNKADHFYNGVLGFDNIAMLGDSAGFVSAGGYHHHIAFNTWNGVGAPPQPPNSIGLRNFLVRLPDSTELGKIADRVRLAGLDIEEENEGLLVRDPSQNAVVFTVD